MPPAIKSKIGKTPDCAVCGKPVYLMEQAFALGKCFHKDSCFKCEFCNKRLQAASYAEHNGQLCCKACKNRQGLSSPGFSSSFNGVTILRQGTGQVTTTTKKAAPAPPRSPSSPRDEVKVIGVKNHNSVTTKIIQSNSVVTNNSTEGGEVTVEAIEVTKSPPISFDDTPREDRKSSITFSLVPIPEAEKTDEAEEAESELEGTQGAYDRNNIDSTSKEENITVHFGGENIDSANDGADIPPSISNVTSESEEVTFEWGGKVATKDVFGDNDVTVEEVEKTDESPKTESVSLAQFIQQNQPPMTPEVDESEEIHPEQATIQYSAEEPPKTSLTDDLVDHNSAVEPNDAGPDSASKEKFDWNLKMASKDVIERNEIGEIDSKQDSSLVLEVPGSISFVKIMKGGQEYTLEL